MFITPTPQPRREPRLPDSELEIMRILWKHGKATAREVWNELHNAGSQWTYATVNTLMQRLETKGLADVDKSGVSFIYTPKLAKQKVVQKRIKDIVEKLFDGKGGMLVMHLLETQRFSPKEITEIRKHLSGKGNAS